jgi:hypothetical protein
LGRDTIIHTSKRSTADAKDMIIELQSAALNVAYVEGQSMTPSRNFGEHSRTLTSYHSRYDVLMVR